MAEFLVLFRNCWDSKGEVPNTSSLHSPARASRVLTHAHPTASTRATSAQHQRRPPCGFYFFSSLLLLLRRRQGAVLLHLDPPLRRAVRARAELVRDYGSSGV